MAETETPATRDPDIWLPTSEPRKVQSNIELPGGPIRVSSPEELAARREEQTRVLRGEVDYDSPLSPAPPHLQRQIDERQRVIDEEERS